MDLSQLKVWWEGRIFLSDDKSNWPQLEIVAKPNSYIYKRTVQCNIQMSSTATLMNVGESAKELWRLHPSRFSRLTKIYK